MDVPFDKSFMTPGNILIIKQEKCVKQYSNFEIFSNDLQTETTSLGNIFAQLCHLE